MLKKVKTTLTYRVPAGCYCNLTTGLLGTPTKDKCRFCVKDRGGYVCVLHNLHLESEAKEVVKKCGKCTKATAGFPSVVDDEPIHIDPQEIIKMAINEPIHIDPQEIIKMAINEYRKVYKQLRAQGYPESMAEALAKKYMEEK